MKWWQPISSSFFGHENYLNLILIEWNEPTNSHTIHRIRFGTLLEPLEQVKHDDHFKPLPLLYMS